MSRPGRQYWQWYLFGTTSPSSTCSELRAWLSPLGRYLSMGRSLSHADIKWVIISLWREKKEKHALIYLYPSWVIPLPSLSLLFSSAALQSWLLPAPSLLARVGFIQWTAYLFALDETHPRNKNNFNLSFSKRALHNMSRLLYPSIWQVPVVFQKSKCWHH